MNADKQTLLTSVSEWLLDDPSVCSAVLFGSQSRKAGAVAAHDEFSDIDLHIVTNASGRFFDYDWVKFFPRHSFCMKVLRPATGGVKKLTLVFKEGEIDLVLIGIAQMRLASMAMSFGLHRRFQVLAGPLNSFATIMSGGYRFLKGESAWGAFYARVVSEMPGDRISDVAARTMADSFLCDLLWVLQKLKRGELVAAQIVLHKKLQEANVILLHELRLRKNQSTFQQARRVEHLVSAEELSTLYVSARLDRLELACAAWRTKAGLVALMRELVPEWQIPAPMQSLLESHAPTRGS